jgi:hypothetical protein
MAFKDPSPETDQFYRKYTTTPFLPDTVSFANSLSSRKRIFNQPASVPTATFDVGQHILEAVKEA